MPLPELSVPWLGVDNIAGLLLMSPTELHWPLPAEQKAV